MLKQYSLGTVIGLVLGIVLVWWLQPDPGEAAVSVVVATTLFVLILISALRFFRSANGRISGK